ncbi:MAG: hypothetical protein HY962_04000 [Ignavibacteriae bacterium]|nr:hypothetical protein [Ignavibacteriota bacterium]
MTREEARDICTRALSASKADESFVTVSDIESAGVTIAANHPQQPSALHDRTIQLSVRVGDHYATAATGRSDDEGLAALARDAAEAAALLPPAQAVLPYPGSLDIAEAPMTDTFTRNDGTAWRASIAALGALGRDSGTLVSAKLVSSRSSLAIASSKGLFAYQPWTQAFCQVRVHTPDGGSAAFTERRSHRLRDIDPLDLARKAVETARAWKEPVELKPARITAIFLPEALADLMLPVLRAFDQQAVDENRSMLRKLDGTSRIGSEFFATEVTLRSDPMDPRVPSMPFTLDGQRLEPVSWVRAGVVEHATLSRFRALQRRSDPLPFPTNLIMEGGTQTLDDIIASTKHGVLIHGFGSAMISDPPSGTLTAPTKDGLFLIVDGKVTRGVRNLVMRESAAHIFKSIEAMGPAQPVQPRNTHFPMLLPPMRVKDVYFEGLSGTV